MTTDKDGRLASPPGSCADASSPQEAVSPLRAAIPIAPRPRRNEPRDGDFSDDRDALHLLTSHAEAHPDSLTVKISIAPRVLYIAWPNDAYRPDDGSNPYHCVSVWLAKDNIVAQAIEARRAETRRGSVVDESAVGNADAPKESAP